MKKNYSVSKDGILLNWTIKDLRTKLLASIVLLTLMLSFGTSTYACTIGITNTNQTYDGTPKSVKVTLDFAGTYTVKYKPEGSSTTSYTTSAPINAGRYNVLVTITSGTYKGRTNCAILTINKAEICGITFPSKSYIFDNTQKTITISGTLPQGTSVNYTNNQRTNVGVSNASASITGSNYNTKNLCATLTVTAKPITITANAQTKVYGSNDPIPTYTSSINISNLGGSFTGTLSRQSGENVGSYNYTIGSLSAGANFTICFSSAPLTITKKSLTITNVTANDKEYDGTTAATLSGTPQLQGVVGIDNLSLVASVNNQFVSSNAAQNILVTSSFTITGTAASNYTLIQPTLHANITKASLTISFSKVSKIYDGTTVATPPFLTVNGSKNNESISATASHAYFDTKEVGTGKTVTLNGITFISPNNNNYTLNTSASNNLGEILPKDLRSSFNILLPGFTKEYDGTTQTSQLSLTNIFVNGLENGDAIQLTGYSSAEYDNIHAGIDKNVTITGLTFSGNGVNNYILPSSVTTLNNTITKKKITITALSGQSKVYDQNSALPQQYAFIATPLPAGDIYLGALSRTAGENVNQYPINVGTLKPFTAGESTPGANYDVNFITSNFAITPRNIAISNLTVADKTYDATTMATLIGGNIEGVLPNDQIEFLYNANFADKNVGNNKSVNATITLTGDQATNYTITQPISLKGNLLPREITAIGFAIADKAADGSTAASIGNWGVLQEIPTTDVGKVAIKRNGIIANFDNPEAGQNKPVTLSALELIGTEASNYILIQPKDLTASINTSPAIFSWNTPLTTTYNGLEYKINITEKHISAITISYTDQNGNPIIGNPIDAGTYSVTVTSNSSTYTGSETKTLTILPKNIGLATFANGEKVYDATTAVTPQPLLLLSGIESRDVSKVEAFGSPATYDSPNVGQRTVTITNVALTGERKDNYLVNPVATNSNWKITKLNYLTAGVKIEFDYQEKIFDGNTSVLPLGANTPIRVTGLLLNDNFTAKASSAAYNSATAGFKNKIVTLSGISYLGSDAQNYELPTTIKNDTCSILPLDISNLPNASVSFANQTKVYDGTTNVLPKAVPDITITGLIPNFDNVQGAGKLASYDNKNVGVNKIVTIKDITYSGNDALNYILPNSVQNSSCSITPRSIADDPNLIVTFGNQTKFYDATRNVIDSLEGAVYVPQLQIGGIIANDIVKARGNIALYDTKNIGKNKVVTVYGIYLTGKDAHNYMVPKTAKNINSSILPKAIGKQAWFEIADQTKIYDGTTSVKINEVITVPSINILGLLGTDDVKASGTIAYYDNKNVGTGKTVVVKNITLTGVDKNNYILPDSVINRNSSITPKSYINDKQLMVTFANQTKVYDGTTKVLPDSTSTKIKITGLVEGDKVFAKASTAAYDNKNVGNNKLVTLGGVIYSGKDAMNYELPSTVLNNNCAITPLDVTTIPGFSISFTPQSKLYDGTTVVKENEIAKIPLITISGLPFGDIITATAQNASYDNKNVKIEPDSNGKIKTVTLTDIIYSGVSKSNYILPQIVTNDRSIIRPINASTLPGFKVAFNNVVKEYDGNRNATIVNLHTDGVFAGDIVTATTSDSARFDNKNVGKGKSVTAYGIKYSGADVANYILPSTALNNESEIYKRGLNGGGVTLRINSCTKVFDGTTKVLPDSTKTPIIFVGLIAGDQVTASATSAAYDSPNVGIANKTVTLSGLSFSGKDANNYLLPTLAKNDSSSITPLNIANLPSARIYFANQTKVYDGTTNVLPVAVPAISISGLLPGSVVTASGSSASYDNKNVGTNKTVTINGLTFGGKDAINYIFPTTVKNYNSSITPLPITNTNATITFAPQTKVYDGTTVVKANGVATIPAITISGLPFGDVVTATATAASYDNKNVKVTQDIYGKIKTVTLSGIQYGGISKDNYILPLSIQNNQCVISPLDLTNSAQFKVDFDRVIKEYDGTTSANISNLRITSGILSGDNVTVNSYTSATFDNKNVGVGKTVTASGIVYGGSDLMNYTLPSTARNNNCEIYKFGTNSAGLAVDFEACTKTYDASTSVKINGITQIPALRVRGLKPGDELNIVATVASYDDKNAKINKVVTLSGLQVSGRDAANYFIPASYSTSNNTIEKLDLRGRSGLTATAITKEYDGTTSISTVPAVRILNLFKNDVVNFTGTTAQFDNPDVSTNRTVTVSGVIGSGPDFDNYIFDTQFTISNCIITRKPVMVIPDENQSRLYDDIPVDITYKVTPTTLVNGNLITLNGKPTFNWDHEVGSYPIELGTINEENNPNYSISIIKSTVNYTITTDVYIVKKYGNTLLINNAGDKFNEYQWYKDGVAIPGATGQYYSNNDKSLCGLFSCEVTRISKGTRVKTARQYEEVNCGGIKSYALYPTILKGGGSITIELVNGGVDENETSPTIVQIYSLGGEIVKTQLILDDLKTTIDAPNMSGAYIVKMTKGDEIILTEKILVK